MKEIAVKFLSDTAPLGVRLIKSVPGMNSIQATHLMSSVGGIEKEHVIVNSHPVKLDRVKCMTIAQEIQLAYPRAIISVLLNDGFGAATVFALQDAAESVASIAAAVACVKAVWGWDESPTFEIWVNDQIVSLQVGTIDGDAWSCFSC